MGTEESNQRTLQTYEDHADRYLERTPDAAPSVVVDSLKNFAELLPPDARVLEIGSGPGRDAALLETWGVQVRRSDATVAFVDHLRQQGHEAVVLNVINDPLDGPYDGVMAMAVLQHLDRDDFRSVLTKIAAALSPGGLLLFSMMEGEGEKWSEHKMDAPRHFVFWNEDQLTRALADAGLDLVRVWVHGQTDRGPWLTFLVRPGSSGPRNS